jgi:ABC-type phosphate transport system substrate-binding protein
MILPKHLSLFFLLLTLLSTRVEAADFVVVVNKENPIESLYRSEVKNIFLGKKIFWSAGHGIDVLLQTDGNVHRGFVLEILNKSPRQLSMYWKQELFSGTAIPPKEYPDDQSVKNEVAANPTAIGYIDILQLDDTVRGVLLK